MKSLNATCPKCDHQFPMDEVLQNEISAAVKKETESAISKKDIEVSTLKKQLKDAETQSKMEAKKLAQSEVEKALRAQESRLNEENLIALEAKEKELNRTAERLRDSQKNELSLRQKIKDVEEREQELDLEVERKTSELVAKARDQISAQIAQDFHRKDVEREELIAHLRKQLIEMKQRAEQGSQQTRGEVFENEVGAILRENFQDDSIEDVPKGTCGGDLIQTVVTKGGQRAGRILWEIKQTKAFQPAWLDKLRSDRNELGAELAILVTAVMPKGKNGAYLDQGVWVVDPIVFVSVARVARQSLVDLHQTTSAVASRHEKADILYNYLTNPVFRQRLEAIVESFHQMRDDLEREKRAISKSWKQRERHLDSVVESTVHIYSDIQSVVGQKVLSIQRLELPTTSSNEADQL